MTYLWVLLDVAALPKPLSRSLLLRFLFDREPVVEIFDIISNPSL